MPISIETFKRLDLVSFLANIYKAKFKKNLYIGYGNLNEKEDSFVS